MRKYFKISLIYIISIAILLIITSLSLYYFSSKFLEPKGYDFLSKINSNRQASKDIVNVVIDESSLYEIGRWPWKRTYYNDIFEYLQKYGGAKLIVFDSIIVSPENTQSDREFVRRIGNTERLITGISFIKEKKFSKFNGQEDLLRQKFSIKVKDKRNILFVENSKYTNFIDLLPGYLEIVKHIGSVSVQVD